MRTNSLHAQSEHRVDHVAPHQASFAPLLLAVWVQVRAAYIGDAVLVAERVREIDNNEGARLLRIIRRGTGSVVTSRRARMAPLSAQGMPADKIDEVTFTGPDRVRNVIHNCDSLYSRYRGGSPRTFTLPERREIKKIAKSKLAETSWQVEQVPVRMPRSTSLTPWPWRVPPSRRGAEQ